MCGLVHKKADLIPVAKGTKRHSDGVSENISFGEFQWGSMGQKGCMQAGYNKRVQKGICHLTQLAP